MGDWRDRQAERRERAVAAYAGPQHRSESGDRSNVMEWLDYYVNGESRNMSFVSAYIPMTKEEMKIVAAALGVPAHAEGCTYDTPCQPCIAADNRSIVRQEAGRG